MRPFAFFFPILLVAGIASAHAQVVPAAYARQFTITAGGMGSVFQPDFAGNWQPPLYQYPAAETSSYPLFGAGAYVDVHFTHWIQLEAEGRWLRFNQYNPTDTPGGSIHEDNYLIGPKVPVYHFKRSSVYAKALVGYGKMTLGLFPQPCPAACNVSGRFTDVAFGGGIDMKLTRRLSFRAIDVEYQYWPQWFNSTLSPYGASVGFGYKIF